MPVASRKSSFKKSIQDDTKHAKLGDMIRKDGRISGRQLKAAMALQKKKDVWIGKALQMLGYINEDGIISFIARKMSIEVADIAKEKAQPEAIKALEYNTVKEYLAIPLQIDSANITLGMLDPTNFEAVEYIASKTKLAVKIKVVREKDLINAYREYYKISDEEYQSFFPEEEKEEAAEEDDVSDEYDLGEVISDAEDDLEIVDGLDDGGPEEITAGDAALIKLVNGILIKSVTSGASDIHIEPYEKRFRVRYRMDGKLSEDMVLPLAMRNALVSRIKIMAGLNIAEKRVPQDGRIKIRASRTKIVDFRVSVLPTLFGESIVMRLLDQAQLQIDMTKLGFSKHSLDIFDRAIASPQGLILVTGPTGSGKTNTLYSAINALNNEETKILTAEDPVEFNFEGINQVLVRNEVGMTFAAALKAFLRQDPEIILVGEIRDMETAEIAVKAANTGHLVFSTLHTNDCPSTIGRLIDIGVPAYMVSAAVVMVLSQRLLRKMCQKCKKPQEGLSNQYLLDIGFTKEELPDLKLFKGEGCPACTNGYKGRLGAFELMECTDDLKQAITAMVPEDQLRKIAIKEGMRTLRRDGLDKIKDGITTIENVLATTVLQKEALPAYLLNPDELVFEDGDLIIREGNTDRNFYQLLQGGLVILKNGRVVGEITQPGDYFGEMSSLLGQPRVATIKSKGKSVVKVFPGEMLKETIENYPDIALKIIKSLIGRLNDADKLLSRIGDRAATH